MAADNKQNNQSTSNSSTETLGDYLRSLGYKVVEGNGEGAMAIFFSNPKNIIWSNESKKPSKHTNACCRNSTRAGAGQTAGPGTPSRCCMSSKDKSLQEYMQKVEQSLLKNNNCTIQEAKRLMTLYDADFPELMKQFPDPKVASLAMVMGY